MAFSLALGEAGFAADRIESNADVNLTKVPDGFSISAIRLTMTAKIPNIDEARFHELADKAKTVCPVSKVLNASGSRMEWIVRSATAGRDSAAYAAVVAKLASFARSQGSAPVFLVGTSQGSIATTGRSRRSRCSARWVTRLTQSRLWATA
jgi:hypothetical protein